MEFIGEISAWKVHEINIRNKSFTLTLTYRRFLDLGTTLLDDSLYEDGATNCRAMRNTPCLKLQTLTTRNGQTNAKAS